jgi:hypothetical protein
MLSSLNTETVRAAAISEVKIPAQKFEVWAENSALEAGESAYPKLPPYPQLFTRRGKPQDHFSLRDSLRELIFRNEMNNQRAGITERLTTFVSGQMPPPISAQQSTAITSGWGKPARN